jgi:alpha-tubulin suppressor-like RCC1 family protein
MFGYNSNGQLGIGNYNNQYTPEVLNPDTFDNEKVIDVALSDNGSYFLTENNNIYTCGENYSGQLGLGFESSSVATPQKISNSDYNNENILKISAIDQT